MIRRHPQVESASATRIVDNARVRRNDLIPASETGGLAVVETEPSLLDTLAGTVADGTFLDRGTASYPAAVLGSVAADRLGIRSLEGGPLVRLGHRWFAVIGILDQLPLAPDIDRSVLIGYDVAERLFGIDNAPSTVRVRTDPDDTDAVAQLLAATANPESPQVDVSRPSDALEARARADETLTALLLGLGAVALLVGGVGI